MHRILLVLGTALVLCRSCPIYLTLSLTGKTHYDAAIVLNWGPECHDKPEWIGLFYDDPSISNSNPAVRISNITNTSGSYLTDVKLGKLRFPSGWNRGDLHPATIEYNKGKCLQYFVASFNQNELLTVECLKINPTWMQQIKNIAKMPLKDLFIPGTHASGAFFFNYNGTRSVLVKDYVIAQHFDIWTQLVFGIRYLDLSVGFKTGGIYDPVKMNSYWIVNENIFVNALEDILKDVKHFVTASQEVVILDFSSFPIGFYKHPSRHADLLRIIYTEIGDIAYEREEHVDGQAAHGYQLCLDDIRRQGKHVLILYPVQELPYPESESKILCPSWKRFSAGFMNNSEVLDYMRLLFSKKKTSPVQDEGWIFHGIRSLEQSLNTKRLQTTKERALAVNTKVVGWLKGPWSLTANVVTLDYFSSTNLIDLALYANTQKAFNVANKNLVNFEIVSN